MFCINCGNQVDDHARFCHHCGAQTTVPAAQPAPAAPVQTAPVTMAAGKKGNPLLIVALAAAIAIIALVVSWVVNANKTIHLGDYIVFEQETGYDGYGVIKASFDSAAFQEDYAGKLQVKTSALAGDYSLEYSLLSAWSSADEDVDMYFFLEFVSGSLDQRSELSNGDVVTWTWNNVEELSSYFNYKVDASDVTYTISMLDEVTTFDAFESISVRFSGYDGYGSAGLTVGGTLAQNYYTCYSISKSTGLSNGDVITVTFDAGDDLTLLEELGAIPAATSATYEVSGLEATHEEDIYQYITVDFSGLNGEGTLTVTATGGLSADYFTISKESELSNGDTITLIFQNWCLSDLAESTGIIPTETTATYTVDGLGAYASSLSSLESSTYMDNLKAAAVSIYDQNTNFTADGEELLSMDYVGSYLVYGEDWNDLYLVYKMTGKNNDEDSFSFYWYCEFTNLIENYDGTFTIDTTSYTIPFYNNSWFAVNSGYRVDFGNYVYAGFYTISELYSTCMEDYDDSCIIESSVSEALIEADADTLESEDMDATETE